MGERGDLGLPESLRQVEDHLPDMRVDPPAEARFVPLPERTSAIEVLREGAGLARFASQAVEINYERVRGLLEKGEEISGREARDVLVDVLYRLEGVIHVLVTLSREMDFSWRVLREHELWERAELERKRLRTERARRGRRGKASGDGGDAGSQPAGTERDRGTEATPGVDADAPTG